jgi:uncharacterized protein YjlB
MTLAVVSLTGALGGCVSFGNTDALITPVGVAGIHSFKPSDTARDINLPPQRQPDQVAANRERAEQEEET